jgi:leader peptidase (prepilin peptidase)/N-methyltransferase
MSTLDATATERWGTAWRHPLAFAGMGLAATAALVHFGATPNGLPMAFFLAVLVALATIDAQRRILPNAIVVPAGLLVLAAHLAVEPTRAPEWILAAVGAAGLLFILHLVSSKGMGMGDVKLAFLLGAGLGVKVISAFFIASLCVWPFALYLVLARGAGRRTAIAFGPFLALGALAAALLA